MVKRLELTAGGGHAAHFFARMPPGILQPEPLYGIVREHDRWYVNLERGKKRLRKVFSDKTYGNKETALTAAQAWRDEVKEKYLPLTKRQVALQKRIDTKFGITGVTCRVDAKGCPLLWTAKTQIFPGRIVAKSFSVSKYGEFAYAMAVAERMAQLEHVKGYRLMHPASLPNSLRANAEFDDCKE